MSADGSFLSGSGASGGAVQRPDGDIALDAAKYRALHTPEIADFIAAVEREALFQREKWGADGDDGKVDTDWFWLIGYLAGKAIRPDTSPDKCLHHIITTAAACLNWHAARVGTYTTMRPGIAEPDHPKAGCGYPYCGGNSPECRHCCFSQDSGL